MIITTAAIEVTTPVDSAISTHVDTDISAHVVTESSPTYEFVSSTLDVSTAFGSTTSTPLLESKSGTDIIPKTDGSGVFRKQLFCATGARGDCSRFRKHHLMYLHIGPCENNP